MPTMKMGRVDNIILTEDQKELHRPRKKDKSLDVFSDEFITGDSPFKGTSNLIMPLLNQQKRAIVSS